MTELDALLILNAIPGLGNMRIKKLIDFLGSAQKVFLLNDVQRREVVSNQILPFEILENIQKFPKDIYLKKEYNLVRSCGVFLMTSEDDLYPQRLKEIPDYPLVLYVKGDAAKLNLPAVAMVGSRKASVYGMLIAEKFAAQLAESGVSIISGLARGIDTCAHRGALKVKGITVAVLGCGLGQVYPKENKKLADEIVTAGALISEFPMATEPFYFNFPRRNRIVSGLSLGVVVVEASLKSGALITSDFALEQGREVFAIPGKVDQLNSQGTNRLIREGAKLVSCVEDILEELKNPLQDYLKTPSKVRKKMKSPNCSNKDSDHLSQEEEKIYKHLTDLPRHVDDLTEQLEFPITQLMVLLSKLEIKGRIKKLPGQLFIRV